LQFIALTGDNAAGSVAPSGKASYHYEKQLVVLPQKASYHPGSNWLMKSYASIGSCWMTAPIETAMSNFPQWVHNAGSIASILSLILTAIVAFKVYAIAKHYRELALVPNLHSKLSTHLKNLDKLVKAKDWNGFQKEIAIVIATTETAAPFVGRELRKRIGDVVKTGRETIDHNSLDFSHKHANELVLKLTEVNAKLEYHIEDKRWQIKT
jgi:hypothetical protein